MPEIINPCIQCTWFNVDTENCRAAEDTVPDYLGRGIPPVMRAIDLRLNSSQCGPNGNWFQDRAKTFPDLGTCAECKAELIIGNSRDGYQIKCPNNCWLGPIKTSPQRAYESWQTGSLALAEKAIAAGKLEGPVEPLEP